MNRPMAAVSSLTDLNVPRRIAWRVMMPPHVATFPRHPIGTFIFRSARLSVVGDRG
jgi:hypothetical protein